MADEIAPKSIEANWADWEGNAFGFGYGTGEPHTIPALRKFLLACNRDNSGRTYEYETLEAELGAPVAWLLINTLCKHGIDIIEYGTSPRYGWLTEKGEALRHFMLSHDEETLIRLACEHDEPCYPNACNCGPQGYVEGRVCPNPFWQSSAANAYLASVSASVSGEPSK